MYWEFTYNKRGKKRSCQVSALLPREGRGSPWNKYMREYPQVMYKEHGESLQPKELQRHTPVHCVRNAEGHRPLLFQFRSD